MKIGILTINRDANYGNKLQNYAVQTVLESLGAEVETIKNNIPFNKTEWIIRKAINNGYKISNLNIKKLNPNFREFTFYKFNNKYLKQSKYSIKKGKDCSFLNEKYDYFITGSDQVWNPTFNLDLRANFITFANREKRISYAASFGVSEIDEEFKDEYFNYIAGMAHISVREEAGAKIVKDLTGKKVTVLLDPTLMLSKEQWLEISERPKCEPKKEYILTYFLGKIDGKTRNKIAKISKNNNLEVLDLMKIDDKYNFGVNPSEFIYLINNCKLMCTDSFHGVVFSLIMKKSFIVFERNDSLKSMNSRLETLLNKFNMNSRLFSNILEDDDVFKMNFDEVDNIIEDEKRKSLEFLKHSLKINN